MSETKAYHPNWLCSRQPYVVSLNITESGLLSDLKMLRVFTIKIKLGESTCQYIKLNNMEGEKKCHAYHSSNLNNRRRLLTLTEINYLLA